MVDCTQFLDAYSEFRDGLLTRELMQGHEAHLVACSSCARYDRVVEQGIRVFRDLPPVEPSQDFVPRLQHRLYHLEEEMRSPSGHASGTPVAFTLAIAAIIGVSAWMPTIRARPAEFRLPPVAAHAPHRLQGVHVLFESGPLSGVLPMQPPAGMPAANLLFYRYSPVGSYLAQPTSFSLPH